MRSVDELAVQSYCFRNTPDRVACAKQVRQIGCSGIEICNKHAEFAKPETFDDVIGDFTGAGAQIVSIGVERMTGNRETDESRFRFCRQAGLRVMSVSFNARLSVEDFRVAEALAEEYDIHLGIHNHGGYDWLGNMKILDAVFEATGPRIGLMLDTAWALDAKQDPVEMAERYRDRLYGVHLKDFTFDRARLQTEVVVGTGNIDIPALSRAVSKAPFDGHLILEYEGDPENPVPALTECVARIRNEWVEA